MRRNYVMRLQIKITGPAGLGMNSTAEIIAGTFAELGYDVIGDNEYQSLIKGGINYFDLFSIFNTGNKRLPELESGNQYTLPSITGRGCSCIQY